METNEIKKQITELEEEKQHLEEGYNEDEYEEFLNEVYGTVKIGSLEYPSGTVLKQLDEIAFNCGLSDYNDNKITEIEEEIDELKEKLRGL